MYGTVSGDPLVAKSCPTLANPWTVACQAPLSMGFSRKNTGVGCHFLLQEEVERIHRRTIHDPDNHNGVITHLEPDILECEVKWASGSITTNKASGGDGIPAELFQILKHDAMKVLHSICQQMWKIQQWPQDWKRSVFIPIPKKGNVKNAQTTAQLHSSHTLVK